MTQKDQSFHQHIVWTIAGSDSGGGAGIQADLKVINAFEIHGCSILTALTAQNTTEITQVLAVSDEMIQAQINSLKEDLPPSVIKTGMLGKKSTCQLLSNYFKQIKAPVICDPVLSSTSGSSLISLSALELMRSDLIPQVSLLTPNLNEASTLLGRKYDSIEEKANAFIKLGAKSVLIKGGHSKQDYCSDFWTDGIEHFWMTSSRLKSQCTHGTGCILSTAIAAALALGKTMKEAVVIGKTYINQCIKSPSNLGLGHGPMQIRPFENNKEDRPIITSNQPDRATQ